MEKLDQIESIHSFLKSKGFQILAGSESEYFGDYYITYGSQICKFRILRDKSFESIDISAISETAWYDLTLVKALIYDEKKLNVMVPVEEVMVFLKTEIETIISLFNPENYILTKSKLEDLKRIKVKQMFPGIS